MKKSGPQRLLFFYHKQFFNYQVSLSLCFSEMKLALYYKP